MQARWCGGAVNRIAGGGIMHRIRALPMHGEDGTFMNSGGKQHDNTFLVRVSNKPHSAEIL